MTVGSPLPESIPLNKVFKQVPDALRQALGPTELRKKVRSCLDSSSDESHKRLRATIKDDTWVCLCYPTALVWVLITHR
jgi:hypothetical protein